MAVQIMIGHVLDRLRERPDESFHCVVTSPPYYGLRDYSIKPQVWGGDPNCQHDYQIEEIAAYSSRGNWQQLATGVPQTRHKGDLNSAREQADSTIKRGFCRCGAWLGSLGLEPTLDLYLDHMVEICREIRRVLRKDGTFWLNIGDSYASGNSGQRVRDSNGGFRDGLNSRTQPNTQANPGRKPAVGFKPKDLMLIPSRLAIRLCDDGWWVRSDVAWCKKAPMPESCTDRPTSAWEHVFLLTKSAQYFYDQEAVKEKADGDSHEGRKDGRVMPARNGVDTGGAAPSMPRGIVSKRNMRNFWLLGPSPFPEAHFATFVPEIPRIAISAGTSERGVCPKCGAPWVRDVAKVTQGVSSHDHSDDMRSTTWGKTTNGKTQGSFIREAHYAKHAAGGDQTIGWRRTCGCDAGDPVPATVLDPFAGAGTTMLVADRLQRNAIGIDLNPAYATMAERRMREDASLLAEIIAE